jgi:uncharacterized protein (DUF58 family)
MNPSKRLLYIVFAWLVLGIVCSLYPNSADAANYWWGLGFALFVMSIIDALLARRPLSLRVMRDGPGVCPVGKWQAIHLSVHNDSERHVQIDVLDDAPAGWEVDGLPHSLNIPKNSYVKFEYTVRPNQRGDVEFGAVFVRIMSPLKCWQVTRRVGDVSKMKVFPDYSKLLGNSLQATDRRAPAAGSIRKRRRGEGTDFRQLREYRQGDSLRSIDWKATARNQRPITREYQEERDQQVVFLLDTGRRMLAQDDLTSHFDHALNAVLTLSFIAQKQGDAVGLMSFGSEQRWISPHKGRLGLDRILSGVYDLNADETAPDYTSAAAALLSKLSKRAFVVLITNLRDEDDSAMRQAVELLSTKHLVMCASLREASIDQQLQLPIQNFAQALDTAAITHYLQQRSNAIKRLGLRASHLIDINPERLALALVNRYLEIKESGQL